MADVAADVDTFLAKVPSEARGALENLRQMIRAVVPDATERIGYGIPAFYYRGRPLVSYGVGTNHCSFYVQSPAVMEAFADELASYDTAKATIRFAPDQPLPPGLVEELVKARMKETDASKAK